MSEYFKPNGEYVVSNKHASRQSKWRGDGLVFFNQPFDGPILWEFKRIIDYNESDEGRPTYNLWTFFNFQLESFIRVQPRNKKLHFQRGWLSKYFGDTFYFNKLEDIGRVQYYPLPLATTLT